MNFYGSQIYVVTNINSGFFVRPFLIEMSLSLSVTETKEYTISGVNFGSNIWPHIACQSSNGCVIGLFDGADYYMFKKNGSSFLTAKMSKDNDYFDIFGIFVWNSAFIIQAELNEVGDWNTSFTRSYLSKMDFNLDPTSYSCDRFTTFTVNEVTNSSVINQIPNAYTS